MTDFTFEAALVVLEECLIELESINGNLSELSKSEAVAADNLILLCNDIVCMFGQD